MDSYTVHLIKDCFIFLTMQPDGNMQVYIPGEQNAVSLHKSTLNFKPVHLNTGKIDMKSDVKYILQPHKWYSTQQGAYTRLSRECGVYLLTVLYCKHCSPEQENSHTYLTHHAFKAKLACHKLPLLYNGKKIAT